MPDYFDYADDPNLYENPQNAAVYVALMLAGSVTLLYIFKKSGFRAMVAVGGGS